MRYSVLLMLLLLCRALSASEAEQCTNCHQEQVRLWQQSDHARAMAPATPDNVLGNFNQASVKHYNQQAVFFQRDGSPPTFHIRFTEQQQTREFEVRYVFGHAPLQQYLIDAPGGRLQVFPFAWDSRPQKQGGQRWYPIYQQENILPDDRLHWLQPLQNWNGMCADCHSSGLTRQYEPATDSFDTTWNEINVSCQSCHGNMPVTHSQSPSHTTVMDQSSQQALGQWLMNSDDNIASWQGPPRDNSFMQTCFGCHSLRSALRDGIDPDLPFLDQFSPSWLLPELYHANGDIKEEDYVYGSFLQSKMYAAGVNCIDCHDAHTMKVKVQGNGLCLQCHRASAFDTPEHHGHPVDSAGARCVNCHMPQTTYMGVDARRDHRFSVPSPKMALTSGTPDTCLNCHQDKTSQWSAGALRKLHGNKAPDNDEMAYARLLSSTGSPAERYYTLINHSTLPPIKKATLIALLPRVTDRIADQQINTWAVSSSPLIRLATAQIGFVLTATQRSGRFKTLLKDPYRAVRVAAALNLAGDSPATDSDAGQASPSDGLAQALSELFSANAQSLWRGEGNLNSAMLSMRRGQDTAAIRALKHSILTDPYFIDSYLNLAGIYQLSGQTQQEHTTLMAAIEAQPDSAPARFAYGMYLIRQKQPRQAVSAFQAAHELAPQTSQYTYLYALALDNIGQTAQALSVLRHALEQEPAQPSLVTLYQQLSRQR